ncbi:MAG: 16S rRNA (cytidine(1402)-2'-O)-methyltransferase [Gemmatimonadaceae bacterium]|jgi:16S rRNA (cytidine1402-2'-O)-methyltransferase|nr:16S rRNA (cytidine(1402)-2'-O)-methyltransferase [Gemmatimonadaceae bacterium]
MTDRAPGTLHVVSTPIGNLQDMTPRAIAVLGAVDGVLCEDTRHSRPMLAQFGVTTPLLSYHAHNEAVRTAEVVARLVEGESFALISDAGTPLLSDPGARLVAACRDRGLAVVAVPGASALLAALVVSGLDVSRFTFHGFPPRTGGERSAWLDAVVASPHVSVCYEAPGRVGATLAALAERVAPGRRAMVARELTKKFEEHRAGTVAELAAYYTESPPRGEIVLLIDGAPPVAHDAAAAEAFAREAVQAGRPARETMQTLVERFGLSRNAAYRLAHAS